jgi:hypothetical protein
MPLANVQQEPASAWQRFLNGRVPQSTTQPVRVPNFFFGVKKNDSHPDIKKIRNLDERG